MAKIIKKNANKEETMGIDGKWRICLLNYNTN